MLNPLLDIAFIDKLEHFHHRVVYARIIALTFDELPVESIEGRITTGTISIDGNSAVRRTCNLTLVASKLNINEYYWGLKSKIAVEVGLENHINDKYPSVIWFPQGIYILNTFNTSYTTNNYQITISGKDKGCLLNGEIGGILPGEVRFDSIRTYNKDFTEYTEEKLPIKSIIREMIHTYIGEPYHNIIINDVDDYGVELLEYRGSDSFIYYFRNINNDAYTNITTYGDMLVYPKDADAPVPLKTIQCDNLVELVDNNPTVVRLAQQDRLGDWYPGVEEYYVAKTEYGQTAGYRLTDLVYPGDLIGAIGETVSSVLDKIKQILYDLYEYFYDINGHFVFQKKKTYINTTWNPIHNNGNGIYVEDATQMGEIVYRFTNNELVTQISHTPNLQNLRNDFSIWGIRKTIDGAEVPIHLRYAIQNKPTRYKTYQGKEYSVKDYDWRELIYQMSVDYLNYNLEDDFLSVIAKNNPDDYPTGYTGYEKYYTDLQGFWRQLYCYGEKQTINDNIDVNAQYFTLNEKNELEEVSYIVYWDTLLENIALYRYDARREKFFIIPKIEYTDRKTLTTYHRYTFNNTDQLYQLIDLNNPNDEDNYIEYSLPKEDSNNHYNYAFQENIIYYKNTDKNYDLKNYDPITYWNYDTINSPELINFWFDFLDQYGDLNQFSVQAVGDRPKAINNTAITSIYFRDTPTVLFTENKEDRNKIIGYTQVQLPQAIPVNSLFTISAQKKSAMDELNGLLYNNSYCIESISMTTIPIYHLEPNTLIEVIDDNSKINGHFVLSKLTIPLTYNGTMSITATKAPDRLY